MTMAFTNKHLRLCDDAQPRGEETLQHCPHLGPIRTGVAASTLSVVRQCSMPCINTEDPEERRGIRNSIKATVMREER